MPRSSRASGEWISASKEPGGTPSASPRSTHTPLPSLPSDGLMSLTSETSPPSTMTAPGQAQRSGVEGSHVKTYRSPASGPGSEVSDPSSPSHSSTLWSDTDLTPSSLRTSPASSPAMPVETLGVSSVRWGTSGTGGPTGFSTLNGSECPSDGEGCLSSPSTLADILTRTAPPRFSLSARAAEGIIRRSERRGRKLPEELDVALKSLASPLAASGQSKPADQQEMSITTSSWTVRRLTPLECERLMGWPDGWTISTTWKRRRTSMGNK